MIQFPGSLVSVHYGPISVKYAASVAQFSQHIIAVSFLIAPQIGQALSATPRVTGPAPQVGNS